MSPTPNTSSHATPSKQPPSTAVARMTAKPGSLYEYTHSTAQFKQFDRALAAAGLSDTLKQPGPFTLLAPTDEAFSSLPKETFDALMKPENREKLGAILKDHILTGEFHAPEIAARREAMTVAGHTVKVSRDSANGPITLGDAKVLQPDVADCTNGTVHVVDRLLIS